VRLPAVAPRAVLIGRQQPEAVAQASRRASRHGAEDVEIAKERRIDLAAFDYESHLLYRQVNRRFAASLEPLLGDNDIIWIHDYHLIPLAAELRRRGVMAPIGFFRS